MVIAAAELVQKGWEVDVQRERMDLSIFSGVAFRPTQNFLVNKRRSSLFKVFVSFLYKKNKSGYVLKRAPQKGFNSELKKKYSM